MDPRWIGAYLYVNAYAEWVVRFQLSPDAEMAMVNWLDALQWRGPPPVVGIRPDGLWVSEGPAWEWVVHVVTPNQAAHTPPAATIAIRKILDR